MKEGGVCAAEEEGSLSPPEGGEGEDPVGQGPRESQGEEEVPGPLPLPVEKLSRGSCHESEVENVG